MTVRETLRFAARLRLPKTLSIDEKNVIVENVILELGLKEAASTIIGDNWQKGISGGEKRYNIYFVSLLYLKRRVSVGIQLLVNPSILFLDEPTTGLDAFTSLSLIETLVNLSKKGRNIVISIHQPNSEIFNLFDQVTLLAAGGNCLYCGPVSRITEYFTTFFKEDDPYFQIPLRVNLADWMIDISTVDNREINREQETREKVDELIVAWNRNKDVFVSSVPIQSLDEELVKINSLPMLNCSSVKTSRVGFFNQAITLHSRSFKNLIRDPLMFWGSIFQVYSFFRFLILKYLR